MNRITFILNENGDVWLCYWEVEVRCKESLVEILETVDIEFYTKANWNEIEDDIRKKFL